MNGAAPVLERMISRPTRSSTTTIGVIHQALLCNRKSTSSRKRLGDDCSAWRAKSSDLDGLFVVMRLALPNGRFSVRPVPVLADKNSGSVLAEIAGWVGLRAARVPVSFFRT